MTAVCLLAFHIEQVVVRLAVWLRLPVSSLEPAKPGIVDYLAARLRVENREDLPADRLVDTAAEAEPRFLGPRFRRLAATQFSRQGKFEHAASIASQAAAEERCLPYCLEQHAFAGLSHFNAGSHEAAEEELLEVRRRLAKSSILRIGMRRLWHYANYFLGAIAQDEKRPAEAILYLESALSGCRRPARGELYFLLGHAFYHSADFKKAADSFERATRLGHEPELSAQWRVASQTALKQGERS